MMLQLKLEKVPKTDLELFKNALNHYSGTLQFLLETLEDRKYSKDLSIAVELWYDIHKKTAHQAAKTKLKFTLHKVYILLDALKNYNTRDLCDYDRSRCNRYYMILDQQLPTTTQLLIQ